MLDPLPRPRDGIRCMQDGSPLENAYTAIRRRLAAALRRLVGPADVEDILQEAFLRCYEADASRDIVRHRNYLYRTAVNLALNHSSRWDNSRTASLDSLAAEQEPQSGFDLEAQAVSRDRLEIYCRTVSELPLQCRRAFLLKKVYGLSQREIAAYLGISENTVEKHIAKGLLTCAMRMREIDAGAAAPRRDKERAHRG